MAQSGAKFLDLTQSGSGDKASAPNYSVKSADIKAKKGETRMSFVGSYTHTLESKKRVFIPAKYREELGSEFYITRKFAPYLSVYTAKDWAEYVDKIASLPESVASELQDFILGAAQKCVIDASGRIVLDERLMKHAKIDKTVVFTGAGHHFRIWAEDVWLNNEENRNLENIRNMMSNYGL